MNKPVIRSELRQPIGWNGQSVKSMLEKSEKLVADTGRYYGLDKLELQTKDGRVRQAGVISQMA